MHYLSILSQLCWLAFVAMIDSPRLQKTGKIESRPHSSPSIVEAFRYLGSMRIIIEDSAERIKGVLLDGAMLVTC